MGDVTALSVVKAALNKASQPAAATGKASLTQAIQAQQQRLAARAAPASPLPPQQTEAAPKPRPSGLGRFVNIVV
jgi:hypothetical protein